MNKKLLYIGLLLPLACRTKEEDVAVPEHLQIEKQESQEIKHDQEYDDDSDMDDQDDSLPDSELDLNDSPEYARGNWYEKQQTLKQAHDVYQEVRQKEASVAHYESLFITKKNELTNRFEEFSQSLLVSIPVLYQTLLSELEKLESAVKPSGQLSQEERIKLTEAQETKNLLTQLKKDLDTVTELYKSADQAMSVLMQQITITHNFEQKAFESYEKIAQVLSDQVAKQLYAEIVAARENIVGIGEYIKGDFAHYFDELFENITHSIALVHQQLTTLKEHGIDLTQPHQPKIIEEAPSVCQPAQVPVSYMSYFLEGIYNFFSRILHWVLGFFA